MSQVSDEGERCANCNGSGAVTLNTWTETDGKMRHVRGTCITGGGTGKREPAAPAGGSIREKAFYGTNGYEIGGAFYREGHAVWLEDALALEAELQRWRDLFHGDIADAFPLTPEA